MMSRTSNEDSICSTKQRISKSKNFQSNIFLAYNDNSCQKRISKPTEYSEHSTTSQIVGLPGCVKRGMYDIKDDKKFYNKQNVGHLYKMQKDYNCDVVKDAPETEYNVFPAQKRFGPNYNANKSISHIFGNNDDIDNIKPKGKKAFYGTRNDFKSQIVFA